MTGHLPGLGSGATGLGVVAVLSALIGAVPWAYAQEGSRGARIQSLEQVTLERGSCYGFCPVYRIAIFANGRVEYRGEEYVKTRGARSRTVGEAALRELKEELNLAGYLGLRDSYDSREAGCTSIATDSPSALISVRADGKLKSVNHYLGCSGPASERLARLEHTIDRIAGSAGWIGTPEERERLWRKERARLVAQGPTTPPPLSPDAVASLREAQDLEGRGEIRESLRAYRRAARGGSGKAAKRLGEIYDKGAPGVPRDDAESRAWYETARQLGEAIPRDKLR